MPDNHNSYFIRKMTEAGLSMSEVVFINPCPIYPGWESRKPPTAKQHKDWVAQFHDEFMAKLAPLAEEGKVILALGKSAAMQVMNTTVAVTKARGSFQEAKGIPRPVMVTLSPAHVMSRPEVARDFETDLRMLAAFRNKGWKGTPGAKMSGDYKLVTDLSEWLRDPPSALSVDTETTGLQWANDATLITIQATAEEGKSLIIPVNGTMFHDIPKADRMHVMAQFRKLMANPKIKVFGHNFKFDYHMMSRYRIKVANWWMDTLQLAFAADENMQSKSLKECVRRWVPEMAGYSDAFDAETDKSRLLESNRDDLIKYGGGDTDACYRLCKALVNEVQKDMKQWKTVVHIQMPALRMFYDMERRGIAISQPRLRELGVAMSQRSYELESSLLKMVPKKVRQKHFSKGLSFGRREFLQDILFSDDGLKLRAVSRLADGSPATDAIHLSNFTEVPFVQAYTEFQKVQKMLSTYVGAEQGLETKEVKLLKAGGWPVAVNRMTNHEPEEMQERAKLATVSFYDSDGDFIEVDQLTEWGEDGKCLGRVGSTFHILSRTYPTGLWKHIMPDGKVHASFFLDRTVTGRSSSRDPNFQNIPKRGPLAKPYRRILIPSKPGNVLIECDQSQAELRFAACESLDPVMLKTYRDGGDIHTLTASKVALVKLSRVTPEMRQKAKAVNFGFLYTMGPDSFVIYARSSYGVTFTKKEAQAIRDTYFATYKNLPKWHEGRREEVRKHGFVRGLLGAVRRLPAIHSSDQGVRAEAERQAINSPIQRIASDVTLMSMVQFSNGCPDWVLPLGTIHDSGVLECPESEADTVAGWVKWCFINPPLEELFGVRLPLPLGADVAVGPDLGSMVELKDVVAVKPHWIE